MITRREIEEYAEATGKRAAADLLLLCGPDGFAGSYEEYKALERALEE